MNILITGMAGFIGYHMAKLLRGKGHNLVGVDSINNYYSVGLKNDRLRHLGIEIGASETYSESKEESLCFYKANIAEKGMILEIMKRHHIEVIIHLAAQPGVRYSIDHPEAYIESNINSFFEILEACRIHPVAHLIFASSSSVYGANEEIPFKEEHKTERPISLYGATKKSNELMAHAYSHLFGLKVTGLRFFTVYGPFGRPDMAVFSFTRKIMDNEPIEVFNNGLMSRDFTYISDIVKSIELLIDRPSSETPAYQVFNIGGGNPYPLSTFIEILANAIGKTPHIVYKEMQPGDVLDTYADTTALENYIHFTPEVRLEEGIPYFVEWYKKYSPVS